MKRFGLILGGLVVAVAALALIVPALVPEATLRRAVSRQIEALTGRVPVISGPARLVLLPFPAIVVENVSIPGLDGKPALLEADALHGTLRLPSALIGRVTLASVALIRPRLALIAERDGRHSWGFGKGALAEAAAGHAGEMPLGSLRFVDGVVTFVDERTGRDASISLGDAAVNWSGAGAPLSASGVIGWRGQTVDVSLSIADPLLLIAGQSSNVRGRLSGDLFKIACNGAATGDGRFEGKVTASAPSLRNVLRWGGFDIGDGTSLAAFKLQSPAIIDGRAAEFSAVALEMDGNAADGALSLKLDGARPKLTGTLAADTLDISPYLRAVTASAPSGAAGGGGSAAGPAKIDPLDLGDLDLRLSAGETLFGRGRLGHMAAGAVAKGGVLELSIGDADAYGGSLNGRVTVSHLGGSPELAATVGFDDIDMAPALGDLFGFRRLEGSGSGSIAVTAAGTNLDQMLRSLAGQARLTVKQGSVVGVDLVEVMQRIERRPLSIGFELRSGRTAFDKADASFLVRDGVAHTARATLEGSAVSVTMVGDAGVADRRLDLTGAAVLDAGRDGSASFSLPFKIGGSWDWPVIAPDPDALIRRSGAAAPLLDHNVRAFTAEGPGKPALTVPAPIQGRLTP